MDKARMDEIRQRAEAASPGPWRVSAMDIMGYYRDGYDHRVIVSTPRYGQVGTVANRLFIAHARTDVPYLLDALRDAQARVEWTRDKPTEAGWYWVYDGKDVYIEEVFKSRYDDTLHLTLQDDSIPIAEYRSNDWFLGPIAPPEPPQEAQA